MMNGTLLCGTHETDGGRRALEFSIDLAQRLDLRLVVATIAEVNPGFVAMPITADESLRHEWMRAERRLEALVRAYGVHDAVERRVGLGDVAGRLAEIAAEEAADLIVIGAERSGRKGRRITHSIADQLASESSIPALVAVPRIPAAEPRFPAAMRG
jgi:nucleotide-binding universal stress UspA family protein